MTVWDVLLLQQLVKRGQRCVAVILYSVLTFFMFCDADTSRER